MYSQELKSLFWEVVQAITVNVYGPLLIITYKRLRLSDPISISMTKLEGNCVFSSDDNVLIMFCAFFGNHFKCWVIFIMIDYERLIGILLMGFWQPF